MLNKYLSLIPRGKLAHFLSYLDKPEYFFLVVGGVFAILLALINPPLRGLDESTHFYRIIQLGEGHVSARHIATQNGIERFGDTFPKSLIAENDSLINGVNQANGKYNTGLISSNLFAARGDQGPQVEGFEGSEVYTPVVYVPQTAGYKVAGLVSSSTLLRMYAARLANALVWLGLLYLAIRIIPLGKWTLVALGLLPINVFTAGTLSADVPTIGFCFLFVAYTLYLRTKERLAKQDLLLLGLLMVLIALAKSAYYPMLLLVLVLPTKLFARRRGRLLTLLLGIPLLLSVGWGYVVKPVTTSLHSSFFPGTTFTPADQLHYSLLHPFFTIYAFANSMFSGLSDLTYRDLFGTFSSSSIFLPLWLAAGSLLLIVFVLCYQLGRTPKFKLSASSRLIPSIALLASFLLIYITFYLVWTAPGDPNINGVQGRYFLPLLPLLIPIFTTRKVFINVSEKVFTRIVQGGTFTLLSATLIMVATHFY